MDKLKKMETTFYELRGIEKEQSYDIDPIDLKTRERYISIFYDYAHKACTQQEVAKKWNLNLSYVSRVIKWAAKELNKDDHDVTFMVTLEAINEQIRYLQKMLEEAAAADEKISILREMRLTKGFRAKVQGLMQNKIDIGDKTVIVNMPNFKMNKNIKEAQEAVEYNVIEQGQSDEVVRSRKMTKDGWKEESCN